MDKQKRPLYFAFVVCLFCLLATLGIQALSTYVTYQNALEFERSYLKSSVDNTITMIDALRAELRQQQEDRGRQPSETLIRTEIESIMRAQFYQSVNSNGSYLWINEVLDYNGGKNYARRLIHPNLPNTEGMMLSTTMTDSKGNTPYQTELDGINAAGSLFYSYYFQNLNSDTFGQKLTYARLYPDYDWIICMGLPYDAAWGDALLLNNQAKWALFLAYLISISGIIGTIVYAFRLYQQERVRQKYEVDSLNRAINYDTLTNARSRHFGAIYLKKRLEHCQATGRSDIIAMFDIDHFKEVNDTYGHDFGDSVLTEVVMTLERNIRQSDILIRWGGDEFILVFPTMPERALHQQLERINLLIRTHEFQTKDDQRKHVTISIGASQFRPTDLTIDAVLDRADQALYQAKKNRDTYVIAELTESELK
jgi:diguanylate cyclase (GGDEF)-like protein